MQCNGMGYAWVAEDDGVILHAFVAVKYPNRIIRAISAFLSLMM